MKLEGSTINKHKILKAFYFAHLLDYDEIVESKGAYVTKVIEYLKEIGKDKGVFEGNDSILKSTISMTLRMVRNTKEASDDDIKEVCGNLEIKWGEIETKSEFESVPKNSTLNKVFPRESFELKEEYKERYLFNVFISKIIEVQSNSERTKNGKI